MLRQPVSKNVLDLQADFLGQREVTLVSLRDIVDGHEALLILLDKRLNLHRAHLSLTVRFFEHVLLAQ